tara:strand:- start:258 stop:908 length:651 start_codon:yes stop_codon:yes gene_type:complete
MPNIEIDEGVYAFLKQAARPFEETAPNDVLRRLLLGEQGDNSGVTPDDIERPRTSSSMMEEPATAPSEAWERTIFRSRRPVASSASFVEHLLKEQFSGEFKKVGRYRYMRESDSQIVYFQNFNKEGSPNLWYRLNYAALETLRESPKEGFVCLTNPAERLAYILPLQALQSRLERKYPYLMDGDLEVNIDHVNGVWRELEWKIDDAYLICFEKIED